MLGVFKNNNNESRTTSFAEKKTNSENKLVIANQISKSVS